MAGEIDQESREMVCYRDKVWDRQFDYVFKEPIKKIKQKREYENYVLLVYRLFDTMGTYVHTRVEIHSSVLKKILQGFYRDYKSMNMEEVDPSHLYWAREKFLSSADYFSACGDATSLFDVRAVLEVITEHFADMSAELESMGPAEISFDHLWTILPPEILVVGKGAFDEIRAYRVVTHSLERTMVGLRLRLTVEYVESDGEDFGLVTNCLYIAQFAGPLAIEDLPFVPLSLHPHEEEIREQILHRSSSHCLLHHAHHQVKEYTGVAIDEHGDFFNVHKRIIVDPVGLQEQKPNSKIIPKLDTLRKQRIDAVEEQDQSMSGVEPAMDPYSARPRMCDTNKSGAPITSPDDLDEEHILLLSGLVYGYSLGENTWGTFAVNRVTDARWDDNMLQSLVMDADLKTLIFDLVKAHATDSSSFDDFVRGKGKGLVGLLFGPPGLGKTLTAEAIAEAARLPLYSVSSGSLGYTVKAISAKLAEVMELSSRWKAVLLLDEADVFLAARNDSDLERNAVVSIFLRELEYYPGIMLLTTNRARTIDPAFRTRIHFCHSYPQLDAEARKKIWSEFARRSHNVLMTLTEAEIDKLAELEFNGRQIKNTMSIAVKLASRLSDKVLTYDQIIAATRSFRDFALVEDRDAI